MPRAFVLSAVAVSSAACLSACQPPVSTLPADASVADAAASSSSASTPPAADGNLPRFIDCVSVPDIKPKSISLDCINGKSKISDLDWSSWDAEEATATGKREDDGAQAKGNKRVRVELADPIDTPQGLVFSSMKIDGEVFTQ